MDKRIPAELVDFILPFDWDVRRVWQLDAKITRQEVSTFDYLLELPLWSSRPKSGMLFDISPRTVMEFPEKAPHQMKRIQESCIEYPIDLLAFQGRNWILDGLHRIVKLVMTDAEKVSVRIHGEHVIPKIVV